MTGPASIPSDQKKMIDTNLYKYLPKIKTLRQLFSEVTVDPSQTTNIYGRLTQTYAEATGYQAMTDTPTLLADGASPTLDSMGTEDATTTQKVHSHGFKMLRRILNSGLLFQQQFIAEGMVQMLNRIENDVNTTLNTSLASGAGQTFSASGGTWATTGDPIADINTAKNSFFKRSGGIPADTVAIHPDNIVDIENDFRFQNTLWSQKGAIADAGELTPKPLGLNWIKDTAVTKGTFFMCKKGMFGRLVISEPYKTYEKEVGTGDKTFSAVFSYFEQYNLPQYLMYGTGI